jgi:hypothetical protein
MQILLVLFCIIVICVVCFIFSKRIEKNPIKYAEDTGVTSTSTTKKVNDFSGNNDYDSGLNPQYKIIKCDCVLETDHQGMIEHNLQCPIFRSRNPGLKLYQYMDSEGLSIQETTDWPPLQTNANK